MYAWSYYACARQFTALNKANLTFTGSPMSLCSGHRVWVGPIVVPSLIVHVPDSAPV
jgi:hypothetical protein